MEHKFQREMMVKSQLKARGIVDPLVIKAFSNVPRHKYVPESLFAEAYEDNPLPIGNGQTISQPYMAALMTEQLELKGKERVLEVGTGSGYQAAILAEICRKVVTIEREPELAERSKNILNEQGYDNIEFICGDGSTGAEDLAPFDGIIVTAGAPFVPEPLKLQLRENGRLVIPVGGMYSQVLVVINKKGREYKYKEICGCVFVPLKGKLAWK